MLRVLIVLHRWVGVALCLLFLLWFPSGIGMMYWGFPSVTEADRLARAPALDAGQVTLTPPGRCPDTAARPPAARSDASDDGGRTARLPRRAGRRPGGLCRHGKGARRCVRQHARPGGRGLDGPARTRRRRGIGDRGGPVDGPGGVAQPTAALEVLLAQRRAALHRRHGRGAAVHHDRLAVGGLGQRNPPLDLLHRHPAAPGGLDPVRDLDVRHRHGASDHRARGGGGAILAGPAVSAGRTPGPAALPRPAAVARDPGVDLRGRDRDLGVQRHAVARPVPVGDRRADRQAAGRTWRRRYGARSRWTISPP